jgi:flagellar biosynthesis/type III secretory pathway M-ring protein FliF/YscJ
MSTGAIIAIVAGAVILLVLLAVLVPRMRGRRRERQLEARRGEMASRHREVAAEQATRARVAESEAQRAKAEAELHEARADMHEHGMADEELTGDGNPDGLSEDRAAGADSYGDRPARRA